MIPEAILHRIVGSRVDKVRVVAARVVTQRGGLVEQRLCGIQGLLRLILGRVVGLHLLLLLVSQVAAGWQHGRGSDGLIRRRCLIERGQRDGLGMLQIR
jgi:hypothetical protein